jgi:hypothetical protein
LQTGFQEIESDSEEKAVMASLDISLKDIPAEGLDLDCWITRLELDLGEGEEKASIHKAGKRSKHQEVETENEEIESYSIFDDQFNLAEMLREQLILSVPIQPLCGEQCQGLCQVCGQDLNVRQCGCELQTIESPFTILRDKLKFAPKPKR